MSEVQLEHEASLCLAVIHPVEDVTGNVDLTCKYHSISRQADHIWHRRYFGEGLRTRPEPEDQPQSDRVETGRKIIRLRRNYHFGPEKIAPHLTRYHDVIISKRRAADTRPTARAGCRPHSGTSATIGGGSATSSSCLAIGFKPTSISSSPRAARLPVGAEAATRCNKFTAIDCTGLRGVRICP